jgi:periplasmic protein TonB
MKTYFTLIILMTAFTFCNAQNIKNTTPPPPIQKKNKGKDVVFNKVEVDAEFNGGDSAWKIFLMKNLNVDKIYEKLIFPKGVKTIRQTAIVKFIVCTDGTLCDIDVENMVDPLIRAEATRVLSKSPNWKPAQQAGKSVKAYRRQPITFLFDNE